MAARLSRHRRVAKTLAVVVVVLVVANAVTVTRGVIAGNAVAIWLGAAGLALACYSGGKFFGEILMHGWDNSR